MRDGDNGTVTHSANDDYGTATWHTMVEACKLLNISRRTLFRWIEQGKIQSELHGTRRMVLVTEVLLSDNGTVSGRVTEPAGGTVDGTVGTMDGTSDGTMEVGSVEQLESSDTLLISRLESEVEYLREQFSEVQRQLDETRKGAEEASERSDTLLLQLTRQLEQSQRMLEAHQESWWRRIFRRRRNND